MNADIWSSEMIVVDDLGECRHILAQTTSAHAGDASRLSLAVLVEQEWLADVLDLGYCALQVKGF